MVPGLTRQPAHISRERRHDEPSRHIAPFRVMNRYVGNLQPVPGVFPDRVCITSPSRVRDVKFTETGSTFCTG
jgi:hypothetical protein